MYNQLHKCEIKFSNITLLNNVNWHMKAITALIDCYPIYFEKTDAHPKQRDISDKATTVSVKCMNGELKTYQCNLSDQIEELMNQIE